MSQMRSISRNGNKFSCIILTLSFGIAEWVLLSFQNEAVSFKALLNSCLYKLLQNQETHCTISPGDFLPRIAKNHHPGKLQRILLLKISQSSSLTRDSQPYLQARHLQILLSSTPFLHVFSSSYS